MRVFLGLPLPEAAQLTLARVAGRLDVGRLVPPENMHLTLAFLDDQPFDILDALHAELESARLDPVSIKIEGLASFGGAKPRLVFADVRPDPPLKALRDQVLRAARRAGIALSHERFHPHITLARTVPDRAGVAAAAVEKFLMAEGGLTLPAFSPDRICLWQSHLRADGPIYEELSSYPLDGSAAPA